jgi:hypothetical protein
MIFVDCMEVLQLLSKFEFSIVLSISFLPCSWEYVLSFVGGLSGRKHVAQGFPWKVSFDSRILAMVP